MDAVDLTPENRTDLSASRRGGDDEGLAGLVRSKPPCGSASGDKAFANLVTRVHRGAAVVPERCEDLLLLAPQELFQSLLDKGDRISGPDIPLELRHHHGEILLRDACGNVYDSNLLGRCALAR